MISAARGERMQEPTTGQRGPLSTPTEGWGAYGAGKLARARKACKRAAWCAAMLCTRSTGQTRTAADSQCR